MVTPFRFPPVRRLRSGLYRSAYLFLGNTQIIHHVFEACFPNCLLLLHVSFHFFGQDMVKLLIPLLAVRTVRLESAECFWWLTMRWVADPRHDPPRNFLDVLPSQRDRYRRRFMLLGFVPAAAPP
jgi:hypothetical protein